MFVVNRSLNHLCCSSAVDEEFGDVATQVLSRTCAMVNKYRRLLMVEAEVCAHTALDLFMLRVLTLSASRSVPVLLLKW